MDALLKPEITVGLRFDRSELHKLQTLAIMQRATDPDRTTIGLLEKAAAATAAGEPLRIVCREAPEALAIAQEFVTKFGVKHPAVEGLPTV